MATIRRFEDLEAWQEARNLTRLIYQLTKRKPFANDFALRDQRRRASISVMSNIAEGLERGGRREFIHFLSIARASAGEIKSQFYVALDEGYVTRAEFDQGYDVVSRTIRLLSGLIRYLKSTRMRGTKFKRTTP
jgi:four helix bundle protein